MKGYVGKNEKEKLYKGKREQLRINSQKEKNNKKKKFHLYICTF